MNKKIDPQLNDEEIREKEQEEKYKEIEEIIAHKRRVENERIVKEMEAEAVNNEILKKERRLKEELEEKPKERLEEEFEEVLEDSVVPVPKKKIIRRVKKVETPQMKKVDFRDEDAGCLMVMLGLILPFVGILISFFWKKNNPVKANGILKGSLITTLLICIALAVILGIQFLAKYLGII